MIKKNLKILIVTSVIILLPILGGILLWNQLPEQIPSHWNVQGEIDGWLPKAAVVFGMPFFMLLIQWVGVFATLSDPKRTNHSGKILHLVFWLVPAIDLLLSAVVYFTAMGEDVRVETILPILMGVLFVAIGNYFPKCRQNYTIGIKIPWTLHSEENWNKTHRLAGFVWVLGGILMIIGGFFGQFILTLIAILPMTLIPVVYSYILHRKGV